jgi:DNA-binding transcriptional LysR family regulator
MPNIMRVSDLHTLRDAAIAGAGLAYLPHFMVRDALKKGTLKRVLDDFQDRTSVYMIYSSHSIRLPRVRALTDYLSTHLKTSGRGPADRSSVLGPDAPYLGAR